MKAHRGIARRAALVATLVIALMSVVGITACSDSSGGTDSADGVPFTMPSRAEIARRASFDFPASTTAFESVKVGDELQVGLKIATTDAAAFETGSGLTLVAGQRVVTHASPIWDLNPAGEISGGNSISKSGKIRRTVEVVTPPTGTQASVRIVLANA